ncbi:MAG: hypothetical protein AcusKO_10450 [Acuticoccus sp.]
MASTNAATGGHLRDFVFHTTQDTSTNALLVGASNNTNFEPLDARGSRHPRNHATIETAGWYTYNWEFYENADGDLEVAMNIHDAAGNWVFTEVRSNPADDIGTVAGSDRYMWFTNIDVDGGIAVDDLSRLASLNTDPVERADGTGASSRTRTPPSPTPSPTLGRRYHPDDPPATIPARARSRVDVEDLTFTGPAGATGIDLELAAGIADVTLAGNAPTDVTGNGEANTIVGNAAGNTIGGAAGDDTVSGGEGDDAIDGGDDTPTAPPSTPTRSLADYTLATTPDGNGRVVSNRQRGICGRRGAPTTASTRSPRSRWSSSRTRRSTSRRRSSSSAAARARRHLRQPSRRRWRRGSSSGGDTINLAAGDIAVEDPGAADGQVVIDKDIDIVGAGKAVHPPSGAGRHRQPPATTAR